mmetsp:Transcript_44076/g.71767  ORF Transcript_44076/g.71767 Transcript_44076/m.71767 type:complete len:248 (+) Transcript_44076:177-920(+)|eukprot:CAMPEP_0184643866 /NCGR_PEP_ID=MMETSP0308-20130426/683_1 /TAXON_ID=38269 /ORGANISM="Gloeochaete witrockiana, Strain SAG 46.84" /LENGTH=247 /DNA_ID=CAMNT_0027072093 /DNA_START=126 /DNA_END=869 /DNA_ORIENTATION=-
MAPRDVASAYNAASAHHSTLAKFLSELPISSAQPSPAKMTSASDPKQANTYDDFLSFVSKTLRSGMEKSPPRSPPHLASPAVSPRQSRSSSPSSSSRRSSYTPENSQFKEDLMSIFAMFDTQNTGRISAESIRRVMKNHKSSSHCPILSYFENLRSGAVITFDEFFAAMATDMSTNPHEELRKAFNIFDSNGDGVLDRSEIQQVLTALGDSSSDQDIDDLLYLADTNHNGVLDFDEFCELMMTEEDL